MRLALVCLLLAQLGVSASVSGKESGKERAGVAESAFAWWVAPALTKVRPHDRPPAPLPQSAELSAAQNEFEPFQIVLRSGTPMAGVDVQASGLTDDSGNTIPASSLNIYLVGNVSVMRPSRSGGETGEWPDPLLPRVDAYFHERRNAFPFRLAEARNQAVWIDIYVPLGTRAGEYRGKITISEQSKPFVEVPVQLNVWDFALPSTSSLATSFGFNGVTALKQHAGKYTSDDDIRALTSLYSKAALLNRVSFYGGTLIPPPFSINGNTAAIDWKLYDQEIGPFLDGMVLGEKDPLPRARTTSVDLRT
ncbi:MAG TPA: hypothetical protein VK210_09340, partial [Terriglobia bacterium]|nr:hypothetical protein [Terriglobia bacterium]